MRLVSETQDQLRAMEKRRQEAARTRDAEPLTPAHAQAEAEMAETARAGEDHRGDDSMTGDGARKAVTDRGANPGPGTFTEPAAPPGAESYDRPYLNDGRSAPSPQHGPPNVNPLPPEGRGILRPIELPGVPVVISGHAGPMMTTLAAHQAKAQLRPSIPPGRTQ